MGRDELLAMYRAADEEPPIPEGEAIVLGTVGEWAELATARHTAREPLRVLAERIAQQAGVPVGELPGCRLRVASLGEQDADGFTLV